MYVRMCVFVPPVAVVGLSFSVTGNLPTHRPAHRATEPMCRARETIRTIDLLRRSDTPLVRAARRTSSTALLDRKVSCAFQHRVRGNDSRTADFTADLGTVTGQHDPMPLAFHHRVGHRHAESSAACKGGPAGRRCFAGDHFDDLAEA